VVAIRPKSTEIAHCVLERHAFAIRGRPALDFEQSVEYRIVGRGNTQREPLRIAFRYCLQVGLLPNTLKTHLILLLVAGYSAPLPSPSAAILETFRGAKLRGNPPLLRRIFLEHFVDSFVQFLRVTIGFA
jgi:hypothetical protein